MSYTLGRFRAKPESFEFGTSSKGNPQVMTRFEILEGPDKGKFIAKWGSLTDNAMEYTYRMLATCGWDMVNLNTMDGFGSEEVVLNIREEPDQHGEMRPTVAFVDPIRSGVGAGKPIEAGGLDAINQKAAAIRLKIQQERENEKKSDAPF